MCTKKYILVTKCGECPANSNPLCLADMDLDGKVTEEGFPDGCPLPNFNIKDIKEKSANTSNIGLFAITLMEKLCTYGNLSLGDLHANVNSLIYEWRSTVGRKKINI